MSFLVNRPGFLLAAGCGCIFAAIACSSGPSTVVAGGSGGSPSKTSSSTTASGSSSSGAVGVLDCAWVAGANCWKSTVAPALSCLPPSSQQGTLSADEKTCTYPGGVTLAFTPPLDIGPGLVDPSFILTDGGAVCLRFDQMALGFTLTTSAGTVGVMVNQSEDSITVTCPDGAAYTGTQSLIMACEDDIPSFGDSSGDKPTDAGYVGQASFSLNGTAEGNKVIVYDCSNE
jgi:hypothetical protein